nr:glutamate-gated chloride channel alpha-like [Cherax quadricarinatus]
MEMKWQHVSNVTGLYPVHYSGDHNLLDYKLIKVSGETVVDAHEKGGESSFAVITLYLQSLCDYHLLNSFAPSCLMFVISYATFFFPIEDFNERIMVSLTSLLVLAGLFAQATGSYVKTPYYKLLDIWYVILIAFCFCVVIVNVAVNSVRMHTRSRTYCVPHKTDKVNLFLTKAKRVNFVARTLFACLFSLLVVIYTCFALDVV